MDSRYGLWRRLWRYLGVRRRPGRGRMCRAGAAAARLRGDADGGTGSELLASLTVAAAVGRPGLRHAARPQPPGRTGCSPGRLAVYALGIVAISAALGRLPIAAVVPLALVAGVFNPAVAGGWTAQLPASGDRGGAGQGVGARRAELQRGQPGRPRPSRPWSPPGSGRGWRCSTAAGLVALAVPAACSLSRSDPAGAGGRAGRRRQPADGSQMARVRRDRHPAARCCGPR